MLVLAAVLVLGLATVGTLAGKPKNPFAGKVAPSTNICGTQKSGRRATFAKNGEQFEFDVCDYSIGDLHFICTTFSFDDAWQVCAQNGWQLATLESGPESLEGFDITSACITTGQTGAWVASYDGMGALPCMWMTIDGALVQSNGFECQQSLPIICQDPSFYTSVVPSLTESATLTVTATSTVQVCPGSPCSCSVNCRGQRCASCPVGPISTDALGLTERWPICCADQGCDPLCPVGLAGLYIINAPGVIAFSQADKECRKYGLTLADLTSALMVPFASLSATCNPDGAKYWIRSFNGVGGDEECVWAVGAAAGQSPPILLPIEYGIVNQACDDAAVSQILCQDRPPAQVGHGPFLGSSSVIATVTFGVTYTATDTADIVTTTITFYP